MAQKTVSIEITKKALGDLKKELAKVDEKTVAVGTVIKVGIPHKKDVKGDGFIIEIVE